MKIICDNCGTKYSIADEKVKGKVFKIRCKKCSNIIVVRGNEPQPAEEPAVGAPAGGYSDAPVWHLVIDQQQVGPMTGTEVRDRFAQGEIDSETYVWREGFTDWLRLSDVEDFVDIAQATTVAPAAAVGTAQPEPAATGYEDQHQPAAWDQGAAAAAQAAAVQQQPAWDAQPAAQPAPAAAARAQEQQPAWDAQAPAADPGAGADGLFGGGAPAGGGQDLFASQPTHDPAPAAEAPQGEGGLFGAASAPAQQPDAGGDLFSGAAASGGNGGQMFPDEEPQPANQQLTGARNENSVLFSLTNLQALAMGGSKSPGPAAASPSGPADGSGLIDIRSMAGGVAPSGPSTSADDDLPELGGFSSPIAAAPVLIPAAAEEKPRWILPAIIGGAAIVVVGVVAVVLVLVLRDKPDPMMMAKAGTAVSEAGGGAGQPGGGGEPPAAKGEQGTASSATEAAADEPKEDKGSEGGQTEAKDTPKTSSKRKARRSGKRRSGKKRTGRKRTSSPAPAPARPTPTRRKKGDALDDLLDSAITGKRKKPARKEKRKPKSAASNLPESLTRSQIQAGMHGVKGRVQGCYDRYKVPGMASAKVTIGRNGRVASARIKGKLAGTPTGACVKSAVRSARFPRFKGSPMSITYPFILR